MQFVQLSKALIGFNVFLASFCGFPYAVCSIEPHSCTLHTPFSTCAVAISNDAPPGAIGKVLAARLERMIAHQSAFESALFKPRLSARDDYVIAQRLAVLAEVVSGANRGRMVPVGGLPAVEDGACIGVAIFRAGSTPA